MMKKFTHPISYKKLIPLMVILGLIIVGQTIKSRNQKTSPKSYAIYALFSDVSGISKDSPVMVSGYQVGYVSSIKLTKDLTPKITMKIYNKYTLPNDSSVSILTDGLLGKKYIEITPGGMEGFLKNDDEILYSQSSIDIIGIVDKYLSSITIEKKK